MKEARHFLFFGRVQGVGFRYQTRRAARSRRLAGWVRNLADGSVEAHAEGEIEALDAFEREVTRELRSAAVTRVESRVVDPADFESFEIRR